MAIMTKAPSPENQVRINKRVVSSLIKNFNRVNSVVEDVVVDAKKTWKNPVFAKFLVDGVSYDISVHLDEQGNPYRNGKVFIVVTLNYIGGNFAPRKSSVKIGLKDDETFEEEALFTKFVVLCAKIRDEIDSRVTSQQYYAQVYENASDSAKLLSENLRSMGIDCHQYSTSLDFSTGNKHHVSVVFDGGIGTEGTIKISGLTQDELMQVISLVDIFYK